MRQEETLDYHFRKIWHSISRIYNNKAQEYGITMSVGFALLSIQKEGTPSTQLGPRMGMEARSLTRMLKNLEEKGWIEKKNDDKDKRVVKIFLTNEGKKHRKTAKESVLRLNQHIQGRLEEEELMMFFKVCNKIDKILDDNNIFDHE